MLSGAELCLLDIAQYYADSSKVLLFVDGPLRERLQQVGVVVEVLPAPQAVTDISREGNVAQDLNAVPGVLELTRRVAKLARGYDVLYANSQKALPIGVLAGKLTNRPVIWHLHDMLLAKHFSQAHR